MEIEEEALKKYPDKKVVLARGNTCLSCGKVCREAYLNGYRQAKKDLTMTPDHVGVVKTVKGETIKKAVEWLRENIYKHVYKQGDDLGFPTAEFLKDFKKYMEK